MSQEIFENLIAVILKQLKECGEFKNFYTLSVFLRELESVSEMFNDVDKSLGVNTTPLL